DPGARVAGDIILEQALKRRTVAIGAETWRQDRHRHHDAGAPAANELQRGPRLAGVVDRLFPERHVAALRELAHEMLRALQHEIPPQMSEADERQGAGAGVAGRDCVLCQWKSSGLEHTHQRPVILFWFPGRSWRRQRPTNGPQGATSRAVSRWIRARVQSCRHWNCGAVTSAR